MEHRQDPLILDFPHPFTSAMAFSNDIDFMSYNAFIALHEYFAKSVSAGGLGLEYTSSIFFYNNGFPDYQLSYFEGTSSKESPYTPHLRTLIKLGYIDTLHGYGSFDAGSFCRDFALKVQATLEEHGLSIPIWSNHGGFGNIQNIGGTTFNYHHQGDMFESPYYHRDILDDIGIRYYCLCASFTHHFVSSLHCRPVPACKRKNRKYKISLPWRIRGNSKMPLNPDWPDFSPALNTFRAADGTLLQEYRRFWGKGIHPAPDLGALPRQITPDNLEQLVSRRGIAVVYQHFATLARIPERVVLTRALAIPPESRQTLELISRYHHQGKIWVTGLIRLLDYITMRNEVRLRAQYTDNRCTITVTLPAQRILRYSCEGLSVAVPSKCTEVFFKLRGCNIKAELFHDPRNTRCIARWPIHELPSVDWQSLYI